VKRIEDMLRESSALKPTLLPQLNSLSVLVSKGVDFAIQVLMSIIADRMAINRFVYSLLSQLAVTWRMSELQNIHSNREQF
jgi:hypothetical protein